MTSLKTQFPVDRHEADLEGVLTDSKKALLLVETKRKFEERGHYLAFRNITRTSRAVIDQG